ncbi:MAG: ATP-binding protein [Acidimicrobiia bacterium]
MAADPSALTAWAYPWRAWLDAAIGREIARLRARYELTLDEFRGVYVSDEQVDRLLASGEQPARSELPRPAVVPGTPLATIAGAFGLDDAAVAALFSAMALELDAKYEALYAYLNDDATRRYATIELCRRLTGVPRAALEPDAPLLAEGLLVATPAHAAAPWRAAALTLASPVRTFVLGAPLAAAADAPGISSPDVKRVADGLATGRVTNCVIDGARRDERQVMAHAIASHGGRALLEVLDPADERLRETLIAARLHVAMVSVDLEELAPASVRIAATAPVPVLFAARSGELWRAVVEGFDYEVVHLRPPPAPERARCWRAGLDEAGTVAAASDIAEIAELFALSPAQIRRAAVRAARAGTNGHTDRRALAGSARAECTAALEELATRVEPVFGWDDLVLPEPTLRRLRELAAAIRAREQVFRAWAFVRAAGGSASLRAMFSGASGTGKTMSAAVVARELGLDLFRIDLSAVVSKYIGETEKNLERIFKAAEGSNAILFFDEADALFGKRSEVKDAHDRYANIEVAYLLQRMETYDGVLILATNLAKHIDEAFSRRIHVEIDFPLPDEVQRERLWRLLIPHAAPTAADVDYEFLARQFPLTGGEIRNVALAAGFLAAYEDRDIEMTHLVRAVARQRRKQGKLPTASEFKHFLAAVRGEGA